MDFTISTNNFVKFLERCRCGKLVKDLVMQATGDMICAKFTDTNSNLYAEVYEKAIKIAEVGNIRIPSIEKLIACLKRSTSDAVRLKSVSGVFMVTDGAAAGKFNVKFTETADEEFVESFVRVKSHGIKFDKEKLEYCGGKVQYQNGFKIPTESLLTLVGDAKAFGFELFNFNIGKDGLLSCEIEDKSTNDKFTRKVITVEKIGEDFKSCSVGLGLKEIVSAIDSGYITEKKDDPRRNINVYFQEKSILFTDGNSYFYNLHTI